MENIYLDHNSTTPIDPRVIETMVSAMNDLWGNPSSVHKFGHKSKVAMDEAREKVAAIIGAEASEIYFTSGGTESDNLAVKGGAYFNAKKGKHVITTKIEHHAVLETVHFLEKQGFEASYLDVGQDGAVTVETFREALTDETTLVSIMLANNETGVLQPVKEIASICHERGIICHTDAVQGVGKIKVDVKDLGVDMLSLSAHKFYGPKGIGVLYVRQGKRITPLFHGGAHEKRRRAGTENLPAILGMARALEIAESMRENEHQRLTELSEYFIEQVQSKMADVYLNGSRENRIPSTVNLSFKGVEGESIILSLDLKGVAVSSGSACTSGSLEGSHVLKAMGIDDLLAQGSIRFSLGRSTTREKIDYTVAVLPEIIDRLRSMSAAYN